MPSALVQPEMTNNLQKYDKQVYLRVSEAQRCRVHSTLVMPVFAGRRRERPAAVFELVQSDREIDFQQVSKPHVVCIICLRALYLCARGTCRG